MAVHAPTREELRKTAETYGMSFSESELDAYQSAIAERLSSYTVVAQMADEVPEVRYPRTPGHRVLPQDNPHNAWYWKSSVKGAASGKLKGKTVSLKDNVMLAGVPMMNGTPHLEGYVPEFDATVVTRMLDAGAEIVGKAHCELLCMTGSSFTNATGPVHNPWRHGYSAGGSSSGSAVTVATGEVDMSIGCDQGGSIRMPSSFCGIYGMKPTHGLVPYTGIMPIEIQIDHAGPMTRTVEDNALLLEVIAGDDGFDPRIKAPVVPEYTKALSGDIRGLKIGILKEGFESRFADEAVNAKVRAAAKRLEALGAEVIEVSVPMHQQAGAIFEPIVTEGAFTTMFEGDGYGASRQDLYAVSMMDHYRGWRRSADDLSPTAKIALLAGRYVTQKYGTRYYGKAMNISRRLRAAYDAQLAQVDLLLMPTTAVTAQPLPGPDATLAEIVTHAHQPVAITCPFDITHHPAMSVPCGLSDGLPVGMMLVGRHFDEATIYRAAHAFEQSGDWKSF
ncbi:amidase [Pseudooceanicola sp. CBS1P-1]|uniref:Amidase n=1 Tax=Pseudooceanicola albus TaxID=2692189 RepID=A0A6L7G5D4_9RHOB|nr:MULTISPECIES: amidase [Pseudooceanicola]MBT9385092.1 amidase [Pseudooceanicola endophyticus]MXN18616.1 amidase [Pseudooceanicola albus]